MINPNDILGTNAAFSGRTSPNAFNDILTVFRGRGVVSGWECVPKEGLTLQIGGSAEVRDVAVVEDNGGNRLTLNTRDSAKGTPIEITLPEADANNPRIDLIVGYVGNPPEIADAVPAVDNPSICAMLVVSGEAAAQPEAPDDSAIRLAITNDNGPGMVAYYAVLARVVVEAGATEITESEITAGARAQVIWENADHAVDADTVSGHTVSVDVPDNAVFTDTTYEPGAGISISGNKISTTNIRYGTVAPDASIGNDGDIYVMYERGE